MTYLYHFFYRCALIVLPSFTDIISFISNPLYVFQRFQFRLVSHTGNTRDVCRIYLQYLQIGVQEQRATAGSYAHRLPVSLYPVVYHLRKVFDRCSGYNLKRKIASLAPISAQLFDRTATKSQDGTNGETNFGEAKKTGSLDNQPNRVEIEKDFTPAQCLFCSTDSSTVDDNVEHMFKAHGMFIPNQEILEDAEGLLTYLFNIISEFRECLYCGKTKETVEGLRSHMTDKGHCKIAFDEELDQFYDFEGGPENGTEEGVFKTDEEEVDAGRTSPEPEHDFHPDSEHELRLPSGRILGHRSLSRYYRQNLHSYPTLAERAASRAITAAEAASDDNPMTEHPHQPDQPGRQLATSARSEMGMIGVNEFEKRALRATEKKALKQETRARSEREWRLNKESNRQKHFKVDVPKVLLHG